MPNNRMPPRQSPEKGAAKAGRNNLQENKTNSKNHERSAPETRSQENRGPTPNGRGK